MRSTVPSHIDAVRGFMRMREKAFAHCLPIRNTLSRTLEPFQGSGAFLVNARPGAITPVL